MAADTVSPFSAVSLSYNKDAINGYTYNNSDGHLSDTDSFSPKQSRSYYKRRADMTDHELVIARERDRIQARKRREKAELLKRQQAQEAKCEVATLYSNDCKSADDSAEYGEDGKKKKNAKKRSRSDMQPDELLRLRERERKAQQSRRDRIRAQKRKAQGWHDDDAAWEAFLDQAESTTDSNEEQVQQVFAPTIPSMVSSIANDTTNDKSFIGNGGFTNVNPNELSKELEEESLTSATMCKEVLSANIRTSTEERFVNVTCNGERLTNVTTCKEKPFTDAATRKEEPVTNMTTCKEEPLIDTAARKEEPLTNGMMGRNVKLMQKQDSIHSYDTDTNSGSYPDTLSSQYSSDDNQMDGQDNHIDAQHNQMDGEENHMDGQDNQMGGQENHMDCQQNQMDSQGDTQSEAHRNETDGHLKVDKRENGKKLSRRHYLPSEELERLRKRERDAKRKQRERHRLANHIGTKSPLKTNIAPSDCDIKEDLLKEAIIKKEEMPPVVHVYKPLEHSKPPAETNVVPVVVPPKSIPSSDTSKALDGNVHMQPASKHDSHYPSVIYMADPHQHHHHFSPTHYIREGHHFPDVHYANYLVDDRHYHSDAFKAEGYHKELVAIHQNRTECMSSPDQSKSSSNTSPTNTLNDKKKVVSRNVDRKSLTEAELEELRKRERDYQRERRARIRMEKAKSQANQEFCQLNSHEEVTMAHFYQSPPLYRSHSRSALHLYHEDVHAHGKAVHAIPKCEPLHSIPKCEVGHALPKCDALPKCEVGHAMPKCEASHALPKFEVGRAMSNGDSGHAHPKFESNNRLDYHPYPPGYRSDKYEKPAYERSYLAVSIPPELRYERSKLLTPDDNKDIDLLQVVPKNRECEALRASPSRSIEKSDSSPENDDSKKNGFEGVCTNLKSEPDWNGSFHGNNDDDDDDDRLVIVQPNDPEQDEGEERKSDEFSLKPTKEELTNGFHINGKCPEEKSMRDRIMEEQLERRRRSNREAQRRRRARLRYQEYSEDRPDSSGGEMSDYRPLQVIPHRLDDVKIDNHMHMKGCRVKVTPPTHPDPFFLDQLHPSFHPHHNIKIVPNHIHERYGHHVTKPHHEVDKHCLFLPHRSHHSLKAHQYPHYTSDPIKSEMYPHTIHYGHHARHMHDIHERERCARVPSMEDYDIYRDEIRRDSTSKSLSASTSPSALSSVKLEDDIDLDRGKHSRKRKQYAPRKVVSTANSEEDVDVCNVSTESETTATTETSMFYPGEEVSKEFHANGEEKYGSIATDQVMIEDFVCIEKQNALTSA